MSQGKRSSSEGKYILGRRVVPFYVKSIYAKLGVVRPGAKLGKADLYHGVVCCSSMLTETTCMKKARVYEGWGAYRVRRLEIAMVKVFLPE
jgi:hypothetical protein